MYIRDKTSCFASSWYEVESLLNESGLNVPTKEEDRCKESVAPRETAWQLYGKYTARLRGQKSPLICRYIEACAAYKWGLTSSGEIVQKVRLRRDSYLVDVVLQAVENGVSNVPHTHQTALNRGLQTIADLDALSASLQALDDFTYVAVRYSAQLWCPCFYLPQNIYIYI